MSDALYKFASPSHCFCMLMGEWSSCWCVVSLFVIFSYCLCRPTSTHPV